MKRPVAVRILVAALLFTQSLSGLSSQQTGTPQAAGTMPLMQQLSALLAPVKVDVSPAVLAVTEAANTKEIRVQWGTDAVRSNSVVPRPGPPPVGRFNISNQRRYPEPPPRQRILELSTGRLFVAAVDKNSRLKSWSVIPDPRIVRSEGPGPDGVLTGQTLYLEQADFFLSVPDDPEIVELRFYQPLPAGTAYTLAFVGQVDLNR